MILYFSNSVSACKRAISAQSRPASLRSTVFKEIDKTVQTHPSRPAVRGMCDVKSHDSVNQNNRLQP